jgi:hypothetical protein
VLHLVCASVLILSIHVLERREFDSEHALAFVEHAPATCTAPPVPCDALSGSMDGNYH